MRFGHLVITRKPGQAIRLTLQGQTVVVRVGAYRNGHVRVEIDAPVDVDIVREEANRV